MGSITGEIIKISLFGESHGEAIGMVIDNLPNGIKLDLAFIDKELNKRKPQGDISTSRKEKDQVEFLSGLYNGFTTGTPLAFIIKNENTNSSDYSPNIPRPSHADLVAQIKYNGYQDYRGGGHFSGRLTAGLVVLGAICKQILKDKGIYIASHIKQIHQVEDDEFSKDDIFSQINDLNEKYFAVINDTKATLMKEEIYLAKQRGDSVGGIIQTVIHGVKPGLGEPFFYSVESKLSSLLFSIGGIKGVSFGDGFGFANSYGSEVKDELYYEDEEIKYYANHNGGINGGISNGQDIIFQCVIKPTASIFIKQKSIDFVEKKNVDLKLQGRHDPCIVHRVRAVIDAVTAYAVLDLLMMNNARKLN